MSPLKLDYSNMLPPAGRIRDGSRRAGREGRGAVPGRMGRRRGAPRHGRDGLLRPAVGQPHARAGAGAGGRLRAVVREPGRAGHRGLGARYADAGRRAARTLVERGRRRGARALPPPLRPGERGPGHRRGPARAPRPAQDALQRGEQVGLDGGDHGAVPRGCRPAAQGSGGREGARPLPLHHRSGRGPPAPAGRRRGHPLAAGAAQRGRALFGALSGGAAPGRGHRDRHPRPPRGCRDDGGALPHPRAAPESRRE
jgi:hypothetical protein